MQKLFLQKKDMNRKLIVTLLRKNIQELDMITEGFMEMDEYPKAIINLAQLKIADIQSYIIQLEEIKNEIETTTVLIDTPEITPVNEVQNIDTLEITHEPESMFLVEESTEETIEVTEVTENVEIVEYSSTEVEKEQIAISESLSTPEDFEVKEVTKVISSTITETKTTIEDTKRTILGEKMNSHILSRNDSLSKTDHSISSTLANKKIEDIKLAISIGDRFRFQRELFRGNGEEMNKTLTYINQLATFNEVQSFLESKYGWEANNETAEDFYQIARRKFL